MITGWDVVPKAPNQWFVDNDIPESMRNQPMYSVLVDVRDREVQHSYTYVSEVRLDLC